MFRPEQLVLRHWWASFTAGGVWKADPTLARPVRALMADERTDLLAKIWLPSRLPQISFRLIYRKRRLQVEIRAGEATYELLEGAPL